MVSIHTYDGDDNEAVRDLKAGLESALFKSGIEIEIPKFTGVRGFYDDNLKVNKFAYRAIKRYNLPILRTWYRYGQFEPYDSLRPKKLNVGPLAKPEYSAATQGYGDAPRREEIEGYLLEDSLKEDWESNIFEFLRKNYQEYAPEPYKHAYLANTQILETLENIWVDDSLDENASDHLQDLKDSSIDLRYELSSNPFIEDQSSSHVEDFLYALERALIALENVDDPNDSQLHAVRRSRTIYHEYVWPLPAITISINEANGPDHLVKDYVKRGKEQRSIFNELFPKRVKDWKEEIHQADLKPDCEAYRSTYGSYSEEIGSLAQATINLNV